MMEHFTQTQVIFILVWFTVTLGLVKLAVAIIKEGIDRYPENKFANKMIGGMEYIISVLLTIVLIPWML